MGNELKEIVKLTTLEILNKLVDTAAVFELSFSKTAATKISVNEYFEKRSIDKQNFSQKITRLKKQGAIRKFCEGKDTYLEITRKGVEQFRKLIMESLTITRPSAWDKKWRIVIFDIPEKERSLRNVIRSKLYQLGFRQIQKSVFVFPFECTKEINFICDYYGGREYIKFAIADIIEGEESIIEEFISSKILTRQDLL